MPELNKFIGIGRLGADPELRYTPNGAAVCSLRLCFTDKWKDKNGEKREDVCWIDATVFGRGAEVVKQYIVKGRELFVEGKLRQEEWEDKNGQKRSKHSLKVDNFQFVGGNAKAKDAQNVGDSFDGAEPPRGSSYQPKPDNPRSLPTEDENDLPFGWLILVPMLGLGASLAGMVA